MARPFRAVIMWERNSVFSLRGYVAEMKEEHDIKNVSLFHFCYHDDVISTVSWDNTIK